MKLSKCVNGHYYDSDKYDMCPHCNGAEDKAQEVKNVNTPKPSPVVVEKTEPLTKPDIQNVAPGLKLHDESKTVGHYNIDEGYEPVVGWLVCIEGAEIGKSYLLKAGRNFIGRSHSNDVVISMDNSISREKHAIVIYDPKSRNYMVQPGMSNELFYVNDNVVLQAGKINARDILSLGNTKLMFVPFCGPDFSWEDYGLGK